METLNLALVGLAAPSRIERREPGARFAPHAGLIGSALELTLSACLVQVFGDDVLYDADGEHKSPHHIARMFVDLLEDPVSRADFLTDGVADSRAQRLRLIELSKSFESILNLRSRGLHAGEGPSREVCAFAATQVMDLMELLAQSSRVRPYLETLPRPRSGLHTSQLNFESADAGSSSLAVRLEPDNPEAIPVAPGFLQQSFSRRRDQWRADVGNANARLPQGTLDLPPRESVLTCFALGSVQLRTMLGVEALRAEHVWPFVASSLNQRGTAGPYWFLVRAVDQDLDELRQYMSRAFEFIGGVTGQRRRQEFSDGIDAIEHGELLGADNALNQELEHGRAEVDQHRRQLVDNLARAHDIEREVPDEFAARVRQIAAGQVHAGRALEVLSSHEHGLDNATRQYWARVLCSACSELEDRMGLIGVLQDGQLHHAHSNARKALRWIDATSFGPKMQPETTNASPRPQPRGGV